MIPFMLRLQDNLLILHKSRKPCGLHPRKLTWIMDTQSDRPWKRWLLFIKVWPFFGDLCWRKPRGLCHAEGWVLCYGDPEGGDQKNRCPGRWERNLSSMKLRYKPCHSWEKLPTSSTGQFSPEILVAINSSTWKWCFFSWKFGDSELQKTRPFWGAKKTVFVSGSVTHSEFSTEPTFSDSMDVFSKCLQWCTRRM